MKAVVYFRFGLELKDHETWVLPRIVLVSGSSEKLQLDGSP